MTGRKPLTTEYVRQRLSDIGFQLHSEYISAKSPIEVTCPNGHRFTTIWDRARQGQCGYCWGNAGLTTEFVSSELNKIGFTLCSEYRDAKSPIEVICPKGHRFITTWDVARRGACGYCANNIPHTTEEYVRVGKDRGIMWVGESVPHNRDIPTQWKCSIGHEFTAPYSAIATKTYDCQICTKRRHHTTETYLEFSKEHEVEWIGPLPANSHSRTNWKCPRGHIFSTSMKSISHNGRFHACQKCKNDAFRGPGHPRWRGTYLASKFNGRLRREERINLTEQLDLLTRQQWKNAKAYFDYKCAYCGDPCGKPHHDHFYPVSKGGKHTARNVIPACSHCNQTKWKHHPIEWIVDHFGLERGSDIYHNITEYFLSSKQA